MIWVDCLSLGVICVVWVAAWRSRHERARLRAANYGPPPRPATSIETFRDAYLADRITLEEFEAYVGKALRYDVGDRDHLGRRIVCISGDEYLTDVGSRHHRLSGITG